MEVYRRSPGLLLLLGLFLLVTTLHGVQGEAESEGPSESECRPYIEKALKELETGDHAGGSSETGESQEDIPTVEVTDDSEHQDGEGDNDSNEGQENTKSVDEKVAGQLPEPETAKKQEVTTEDNISESKLEEQPEEPAGENNKSDDTGKDSKEDQNESAEMQAKNEGNKENSEEAEQVSSAEDKTDTDGDVDSDQIDNAESEEKAIKLTETLESVEQVESVEQQQGQSSPEKHVESREAQAESQEDQIESKENQVESKEQEEDQDESNEDLVESRKVQPDSNEEVESKDEQEKAQEYTDATEEQTESVETTEDQIKEADSTAEEAENEEKSIEEVEDESYQSKEQTSKGIEKEEDSKEIEGIKDDLSADITQESDEENKKESVEELNYTAEEKGGSKETAADDTREELSKEETGVSGEKETGEKDDDIDKEQKGSKEFGADGGSEEDDKTEDKTEDSNEISDEVEELSIDVEMPSKLRPRDHVEQLLKLDDRSLDVENIINKVSEITLKELKKLYKNAIKPLEVLFKYRDLSNRHFGDAEIFSKPLILFMGPWSGGKSSIINYLVNNEFNETSLRTGAEPSPAYFNILMYGDEPEVIDGTELAADFTFSGLQKFGQGLEERLRGYKIPTKLLEKVNIVEIPGILEVRKQVSRVFPFNDACQWFIDRADIIFLVYDPSKLDVGPETEAILDQLKGREHQTRIVLNKADQIKPEELMRVQGALIWNISPLMSSPQPPIMYTASLWSRPYESWAPVRLLQAQERAFLRDLRSAIDKRIENKIASARRFAVRVRNHAKMVDCYLTTYYNHKSVFGNRKQVADEIIEHPQDYHIYEGLSTLTNISRYDLPDPDVYRDFFKLNPLYEFQQLSATCTYFRGCPINRLDVAIAYDLPELVGTYKKLVENALADSTSPSTSAPGS